MDFATGNYANKVYATSYKDRSQIASAFLQILPAYIKEVYNEDAAKAWCHWQEEEEQVTFDYDSSGNWKGTWTTEFDRLQSDLLEESMGYVHLDNLAIVDQEQVRVFRTDDASFNMGRSVLTTETKDRGVAASDTSVVDADESDTGEARASGLSAASVGNPMEKA